MDDSTLSARIDAAYLASERRPRWEVFIFHDGQNVHGRAARSAEEIQRAVAAGWRVELVDLDADATLKLGTIEDDP